MQDTSEFRRPSRPLLLLLLLAAGLWLPAAHAQVEVTGFGSNPGNLRMFKVVPAGLPADAPVVVALHGCSQTAASYDAEPGWTLMAERWKFVLVLPQQQSANNSSGCFNWFEPGDTARGGGEALSVKQMVDRALADHAGDPSRVYVTGLSAGGAMTASLLAAYPDVFAGGAIVAGIPHGCATSMTTAFSCMNPGTDLTPAQWGDRVRAAYPGYTGQRPFVSIWHGSSDYVVGSANLAESMQQWTNVHGIDQVADTTETVDGYPRATYRDAAGNARVETWSITGMGHGTPVDPGTGATQCGTAGAYILDANICSSYRIGLSWGLDGGGGDDGGGDDGGGGGNTVATFASEAANDGYVKAAANGDAPAVGTLEGSFGLAVGRGTDGKANRTLLSFDTSAIPDSATIVSATVTLTHRSASGNPWSSPAGNALLVDAHPGCVGGCETGASDWAAAMQAGAVATVPAFTSGTRASSAFSAAGLAAINRGGRTQLRLRFASQPASTAYVWVGNGAQATLRVEYTP